MSTQPRFCLGRDLLGQALEADAPEFPYQPGALVEACLVFGLTYYQQVIAGDRFPLWGVWLPLGAIALRVFKPWRINPRAWAMYEGPDSIWVLDLTETLQPQGHPYVDAVYSEHWREVQALRQCWSALDCEWISLQEVARSLYGTAAQRKRFTEVDEQRTQAWRDVCRVTRAYHLPLLDASGIRWGQGAWKVGG